jgi:hypothetical protein
MNEDPTTLRKRAAHCRRLAYLLLDQKVAAELATFAADLDAEAGRREDGTAGHRDHAA